MRHDTPMFVRPVYAGHIHKHLPEHMRKSMLEHIPENILENIPGSTLNSVLRNSVRHAPAYVFRHSLENASRKVRECLRIVRLRITPTQEATTMGRTAIDDRLEDIRRQIDEEWSRLIELVMDRAKNGAYQSCNGGGIAIRENKECYAQNTGGRNYVLWPTHCA